MPCSRLNSEVRHPGGEKSGLASAGKKEIMSLKATPMGTSRGSCGVLKARQRTCCWRGWLRGLGTALGLSWTTMHAATEWLAIGDSLTAEYEGIPNVPGVEDPTAYAQVTVPSWEAMSWVEVLGRLRGDRVDLGEYSTNLLAWNDLRFSGYENNFAIPGFEASQYEDIVNSSWLSHPEYLLFRGTLREALKSGVTRVVVWLGSNEFRAQYGYLYDGGDPGPLIQGLSSDVGEVLDFVLGQKAGLEVVLVNLADLGVTPSKREAHPDPVKRARVTEATMHANEALSALARSRQLPLADVFGPTHRLDTDKEAWVGPVSLMLAAHPDNHPRYYFTREGLHPNTVAQVAILNAILEACNEAYDPDVPLIGDGEALALVGLDPNLPYLDWAAAKGLVLSGMGEDPDQDGWVNVVEYAMGLDPTRSDPSPVQTKTGPGPVLEILFTTDPARSRHVQVHARTSVDLRGWIDLAAGMVTDLGEGRRRLEMPADESHRFVRLDVEVLRP